MRHPQVPLGDIADFINGAAFKPEDWGEDGLPIIRIQNLTDSSKPFNYTRREVSEKLVVNPGDLLVSWSATLGVFRWNGPKGLLNQHIFRVLPDDTQVDGNYLRHALGRALEDMELHLHGATMKHVNRGEFLGTKIPLPPLEEQRRIAAILDRVQSLKDLFDARRGTLGSFEGSLFRTLFGDRIEQSSNWKRMRFADLCSRLTVGVVVRPASYYCEVGVPALRSLNVKSGRIQRESFVYVSSSDNDNALVKPKLSSGDLVFVRTGRPGTCAVIPTDLDGCNAIDLLLATVNTTLILPEFACSFFNSSAGKAGVLSESRGQIQQHFNAGSLAESLVPVPPLELQQQYCEILGAHRNRMKRCDLSVDELGRLAHSIGSGLLSGV